MKFTIATALTTLVALTSAQPLDAQTVSRFHGRDTNTIAQLEKRKFTGKMTYYTPGSGSCGVTNTESDLIVAIPVSLYGTYANPNSSPVCQKKISISYNGQTVQADVKDKCQSCKEGEIDVSPAVFKKFGSLDLGKMTVTWEMQ